VHFVGRIRLVELDIASTTGEARRCESRAAAAGTTGFKVPAVGDVLWLCQGCDLVSPGNGGEEQTVRFGSGCS
jgi:hypothetical protein